MESKVKKLIQLNPKLIYTSEKQSYLIGFINVIFKQIFMGTAEFRKYFILQKGRLGLKRGFRRDLHKNIFKKSMIFAIHDEKSNFANVLFKISNFLYRETQK